MTLNLILFYRFFEQSLILILKFYLLNYVLVFMVVMVLSTSVTKKKTDIYMEPAIV